MSLCSLGQMIDLIYQGNLFFEEFSCEALKLGVERFNLDFLRKEYCFYGPNNKIFSHDLPQKEEWVIGRRFDGTKIETAIKAIDSKQISALEFHQAIAHAGVVFGHVYLKSKKILYLGLEGDVYEESWN